MHVAAQEGHLEIVKLLVNNGADLSIVTNESHTALDKATIYQHTDVVQFLSAKMQTAPSAPSRSQSLAELEDALCCPITLDIMEDPVVASDGHTYERAAITEWIQNRGTSPVTQQSLSIRALVPNLAMKHQIEMYRTNCRQPHHR